MPVYLLMGEKNSPVIQGKAVLPNVVGTLECTTQAGTVDALLFSAGEIPKGYAHKVFAVNLDEFIMNPLILSFKYKPKKG